jgi:hypothetical protein
MASSQQLQCDKWLNQRTSLKNDCCETSWKNTANDFLANYALYSPAGCTINQNFLCEPGLNQQLPTLLCDKSLFESQLRNGCSGNQLTHTGEKQNLNVRPYRSVPFMGECMAPLMDTDTYSMLLSGESTRTSKTCNIQANLERWDPQVPCIKNNIQDPVHYIPQYWVRGGMSTSAYYRNIDYLKACGIKECQSECQDLFCPDTSVSERIKRQKMQGMNLPCLPGGIPLRQ